MGFPNSTLAFLGVPCRRVVKTCPPFLCSNERGALRPNSQRYNSLSLGAPETHIKHFLSVFENTALSVTLSDGGLTLFCPRTISWDNKYKLLPPTEFPISPSGSTPPVSLSTLSRSTNMDLGGSTLTGRGEPKRHSCH